MTRQNVSDGVREIMTVTCPTCDGEGRVLSEESVAIDAIRELRRVVKESKSEAFHVALHPNVAAIIIGPGGSKLRELEKETRKFFTLEGVEGASLELFEVRGEGSRDRIERAAVPVQEGQEIRVSIAEPHMYAETDAIARLESGYVVVVAGAGPYIGEEHRVRLDRVTRTAAYATLLDAPPMIAVHVPPGDRESDILEPQRRVGERIDIEGRVKRQRRRGGGESRKETRQNGAAPVEPAALEDVELEDVSDDVVIALPTEGPGDGAEEGTGKKRRRRRGGRGRRRGAAAEGAEATAAEAETGAVADETEPAEGETEVGEAETAEAVAGESSSAKRRRRRRRRGGRGRGGVDAATIGEDAREEAAAEEPVEVVAVLSEAAPVEEASEAAPKPRSRRRRAVEPKVAAEAVAPAAEAVEEPAPKPRSRRRRAVEPEVVAEAAAPAVEEPAPKPRAHRRKPAEVAAEAVAEPAAVAAGPEPAKPRRSRRKAAEPEVVAEVAEIAPEPAKPRRSRGKAAEPEVAAEAAAVIESPAPAEPEPAKPRRTRKKAAEPEAAPTEVAADAAEAPAPRTRRRKAADAEPAEPAAPAAAPRRRRTAAAAATADGAETAEAPRPRSSRRRTAASEPVAAADAPSGIGGLVSRVLGRRSRS
jgi:predicted RNA-binding protein with TRAM domain